MVNWKYVHPLKVGGEVQALELAYSYQLPEDLKECIRENNAGMPKPSEFDTEETKGMVFGGLLSFNREDGDNVYSYLEQFETKDGKLTMFPFGLDPFGNLFCIKDNKIVFYDHETDGVFNIADSFTQFLTMLK